MFAVKRYAGDARPCHRRHLRRRRTLKVSHHLDARDVRRFYLVSLFANVGALNNINYSGKPAFITASRIFIRSSGERRPLYSGIVERRQWGIMRRQSAITR